MFAGKTTQNATRLNNLLEQELASNLKIQSDENLEVVKEDFYCGSTELSASD